MTWRFTRVLILSALCVLVLNLSGGRVLVSASPVLVFSGLNFPVSFKFTGDGRIFYNEKNTGQIRIIFTGNGTIAAKPFATLGPFPPNTDVSEQGLLGLALDPDFNSNHYVYVYWTFWDGTHKHVVISRFSDDNNVGVSQTDIFDLTDPNPVQPPTATNHNGGYIKFGPDGKLYVLVGEFTDTALAQDLSTYAGKILRMNSDGSVPSDNPFSDSLIWAYGIRNGFGMDFGPNGLIATFAGFTCCDKLAFIYRGANYGWPICTIETNITCGAPYTPPLYEWNRPTVTPNGIAYTSIPNVLYFGEFNTGNLMRLALSTSGTTVEIDTVATGDSIIAVENGLDGMVYFSTPTAIYKISPTSGPGVFQVGVGSSAIWRSSNGAWYIRNQSGTSWAKAWGTKGDKPLLGKFSTTSSYDVIIFRNGIWYILTASSGYDPAQARVVGWGTTGDRPFVDAQGDLIIYRNGAWFILTAFSDYDPSKPRIVGWGTSVDTPFVDSAGDLIIYHNGLWSILTARSNYDPNQALIIPWGTTGDIPLVDAAGDLLIFRSGGWFILTASSNYDPNRALLIGWGTAGDVPLVDIVGDLVIFRNGAWFILTASSDYVNAINFGWGTSGDTPLVPN